MRWLTLLALAGLVGGIYHHRRWRARRRMLLAQPDAPVIAVVTTETGIAY